MMAKAYWISTYKEVIDAEKLAKYADLAGPALVKNGAKVLARGMPAEIYEAGLNMRTVLLEFDSVEAAIAAHDSPEYKVALDALEGGVVRDLRIIEGVE